MNENKFEPIDFSILAKADELKPQLAELKAKLEVIRKLCDEQEADCYRRIELLQAQRDAIGTKTREDAQKLYRQYKDADTYEEVVVQKEKFDNALKKVKPIYGELNYIWTAGLNYIWTAGSYRPLVRVSDEVIIELDNDSINVLDNDGKRLIHHHSLTRDETTTLRSIFDAAKKFFSEKTLAERAHDETLKFLEERKTAVSSSKLLQTFPNYGFLFQDGNKDYIVMRRKLQFELRVDKGANSSDVVNISEQLLYHDVVNISAKLAYHNQDYYKSLKRAEAWFEKN